MGKHVINLYSTGISRWLKIKNVKKLRQDIENDPIIKDQMANLGCIFVCTFGDYLAPVLVAAHIVRKAVEEKPGALKYVLDHFKTKGMCNKAVEKDLWLLTEVPSHFKTQKMCNKAVDDSPWLLEYVTDQYKTKEMCDKAVKDNPFSMQFVPDWFVTKDCVYMWYDDLYDDDGNNWDDDGYYDVDSDHWDNDDNEDKFLEWYDGYKKQKAQKASIKEELLPIAWYPSRYWDWCMSQDEKQETGKLWT